MKKIIKKDQKSIDKQRKQIKKQIEKEKQIEIDNAKKIIQKELETCGPEEKYWLEYAVETHGIEHVKKRIEERKEARKKAQETRDCERKLLRSDSLAINIKHRTPLCGSYLIYSLVRNLPLDLQLAILGEFEKADKLLKAKPTDKEKKDLQDKLQELRLLVLSKNSEIEDVKMTFEIYLKIIGIAVVLLIFFMWVYMNLLII